MAGPAHWQVAYVPMWVFDGRNNSKKCYAGKVIAHNVLEKILRIFFPVDDSVTEFGSAYKFEKWLTPEELL